MRYILSAMMAALFAGTAHAAPMRMTPGMAMDSMKTSSATQAPDPMAGMSMEQQMALCSSLESQERQGKTLSPTMKQQSAACHGMTMGASAQTAPPATQER
ncbi:hypothetical protein GLI01_27460 [Gluconacetobacter liquefaciens]|uniref:Pentapeptide MXKDX repeat protein n=1 Tax=Gluconacetobacter liquefaciens TaxID=89584 RepID=A0A370FWX3_GLULI|nr:hypothetical protein [Gluconacetobacter liquefaciens]MBB2188023.1 hypothetical protein [Gluconacetobacter liquefaciens]RDI36127.1 hypothetical protein C7453_1128 [Gluconacetobacter liquefaciens]GBQ92810.1 hypothetical protein AA0522_0115 [Gluconacetobacter liquefaciens NRIC 0522]GEB38711.1 hypothetical protein GLI01_27460 [Gluconacetobacter liquefaciens]